MRTIKVWDIFVRFFHWSLVISIIIQLATAEDAKGVHAVVGYLIVTVLALRIIWGFIGAKHARFKDFIYPPTEMIDYLKGLFRGRPKHYMGHNPAGGAMVVLLLFVLGLTTLTGLLTYGAEGKGPLAMKTDGLVGISWADDESEGSDDVPNSRLGEDEDHTSGKGGHFWKEIHETLVGILLFLAGLHVCGVIASSYVHKENLILAMITGRKKVE